MPSFSHYCRFRELIEIVEEQGLISRETHFGHLGPGFVARLLESEEMGVQGREPSALSSFVRKLSDNIHSMTKAGLGSLSPRLWSSIKSAVSSVASRSLPIRLGLFHDPAKFDFGSSEEANDDQVREALRQMQGENRKSPPDFEEMRMFLSIFNQMLKVLGLEGKLGRSEYYRTLNSYIENPSRFMDMNTPVGGWSHKLSPLASSMARETGPIQRAAELVARAAKGTPEEKMVVDAVRKTLEDMTDLEIRSIVWADRRFKKGKAEVSRVLAPYGVDQADLSMQLRTRPSLKRRFKDARVAKSEFKRRRKPEPTGDTEPTGETSPTGLERETD